MSNIHVYNKILAATDEAIETLKKTSIQDVNFQLTVNVSLNAIRGLCFGAIEQLKKDGK